MTARTSIAIFGSRDVDRDTAHTRFDQPKSIQSRLERADRLIELQLPGRKSARAFRNRYMVDLCGIVIGFRSGKGSGTQAILKYALRNQREVHAIPVLTTIDDGQRPAEVELAGGG